MLYTLQIKLETPALGEKRHEDGVRRFVIKSNNIKIKNSEWEDRFSKSLSDCGFICDSDIVSFDWEMRAPTLHMYRRVYNKTKYELFEAMRTGTVLTTEFLKKHNPSYDIDDEQLKQAFSHMGKYYGISEWGVKYGYGRFVLVNLFPKYQKPQATE